ncbi:hypothetical protein AHAS_Ahas07G0125000 [Arachis hypogaea]
MEVGVIDAILAQNKLLYQQMNLTTQQLSSMQSLVAKVYSAPPYVAYDMSGGFLQGGPYNYGQCTPKQMSKRIPEGPLTLPSDTVPTPREELKTIIVDTKSVPKEEVQVANELEEEKAQERLGAHCYTRHWWHKSLRYHTLRSFKRRPRMSSSLSS